MVILEVIAVLIDGGKSFSNQLRQSFKAVCADCGIDCDLPFKLSGDRPVYCRDCFAKHKPENR